MAILYFFAHIVCSVVIVYNIIFRRLLSTGAILIFRYVLNLYVPNRDFIFMVGFVFNSCLFVTKCILVSYSNAEFISYITE